MFLQKRDHLRKRFLPVWGCNKLRRVSSEIFLRFFEIWRCERRLCKTPLFTNTPFRILFRLDSTTPSSLRLLLNVCVCTEPHVPPTKIISFIFQPLFSPSASSATFSRLLTRTSCWARARDSPHSRYVCLWSEVCLNSRTCRILLLQSIAIESGLLLPNMTSL